MDWEKTPKNIEWLQRNVWLALTALIFGILFYAGYSFIDSYATKFGETTSEFTQFRRTITSYTVIDILLQPFLLTYHASSITIGRFHRDQIIFENTIAAPGSKSDSFPDVVPVDVFSIILPQLLNGKPASVHTADLPDNALKKRLSRNGIKTAVFVPIQGPAHHLMGMVMLTWLNDADVPVPTAMANLTRSIVNVADQIGTYFVAKE